LERVKKMKILDFVKEMKEKSANELLEVSGTGKCTERTYKFKIGHADIVTIQGGAIEKAAIMHMVMKGISIKTTPGAEMGVSYSGENEQVDAMVYQMEIFPTNPYCPMGHFNTEWSSKDSGAYQYTMNLDLFPAVAVEEDLKTVQQQMDHVADQFGKDRNEMRKGLDIHYNMNHWSFPLATKVGCKLAGLEEEEINLFMAAYRTIFEGYIEILKKRKDHSFSEDEAKLKMQRNAKWLEYLTLKDDAIKMALAKGIPPEVLIAFSFPPSAIF
jgi:coproporphyrinogen III oxidase